MADELKMEDAIRIARRLKTIPGMPWDDDVTMGNAQDLVRWCRGAILDGRNIWSAEAQAEWLVTTARETWEEKWLGTAALYGLFRAKFKPERRPELERVSLGEKPPVSCRTCGDGGTIGTPRGYKYCDCKQGVRMAADPVLGEKWLYLLNGKRLSDLPKVEPRREEIDSQGAAFFEARLQIREIITEAEATLADDEATSEQKELARETLHTYRGELKKGDQQRKKKPA
jgi:hypothetical protein